MQIYFIIRKVDIGTEYKFMGQKEICEDMLEVFRKNHPKDTFRMIRLLRSE